MAGGIRSLIVKIGAQTEIGSKGRIGRSVIAIDGCQMVELGFKCV